MGGDELVGDAILLEHRLVRDLDLGLDILGGVDGEAARRLVGHPAGLDAPARIGGEVAQRL